MIRLSHTGFIMALAAAVALLASAAHAQMNSGTAGFHPPYKERNQPKPDDGGVTGVPPPALPGAANVYEPAEKTQLDLPPTEALFDAINRGDIASARDALSRGADLNGRNLLGLTPIDLSVDLSRNDITFLLLSMRAADATPLGPAAKTAKNSAKAVAASGPAKPPAQKPAVAKLAATKPVLPAAPRQFAGPADTGVANPQAGFLGFGGTVQ